MNNSPTLCQKFVDTALHSVRQDFPEVYLIHYMDDILIAHSNIETLQAVLTVTILTLEKSRLQIAPEKFQAELPLSYLDRVLQTSSYTHQSLELRRDRLQTLNDFQKLLGDINWIRPLLKLTSADLKPLFHILQGDSNPMSPRRPTPEASKALGAVEKQINTATLRSLHYSLPWSFVVLSTCITPTGCLWQDGVLEWIHLPATSKTIVTSYPSLTALLILKGRKCSIEPSGKESASIILPYNKEKTNQLLQFDEDWQITYLYIHRITVVSPT